MRAGALLSVLMLVACDAREPKPAPPPVAEQIHPSPPLVPVMTLAGEWRIAGIDGKPVDGPLGLALSGDARQIWWEPKCANFVRSYTIDGSQFAAGPRIDLPPPKPGEPTPPVCTIAPPAAVNDVFAAIDAATQVSRTAQNGIQISGGGHSLLLFSQ